MKVGDGVALDNGHAEILFNLLFFIFLTQRRKARHVWGRSVFQGDLQY